MQARLPLQWRSVIHPDDLTTVMAEAEAAAAEKRAFEAEYRLLRADGVYRWHLGRSVVVSDSEGRPLRKIGSATDIHEQRESRELIRALKQRTDAIIQDAPILLWAVDTAGIVTYYDGKVKKILGIRTEDRIGTNLIDLYRTRPEVAENIRRALRGEIVSDESKIGDICLENKFSPQYDTAGVINGVVGLSVDITERKRAEHERTEATARAQSAIETSRLKSEFLANMSHEIRTPLNGVLGMSGLLLDTSLTPDQREFTSAIQRSGENLLTLINDILDFSKIEAGRLDLEDCPFDLREVFTDLEKAMGFAVRAKNLRLSVEIDPRLPAQVSGDGGRLRQVLLNLVGNAIKFTTFGAVTVTIRAGESTGARTGIRVDVVDTGIGIPADTLGNLFRPFTQADASMARRYGGSGLGLSISKGLVERMGGEIGAVSQVGSGSRFWFTGFFGIVDAEMEIAPSTPAPARTDFTGVRVLVADDIVMNQVLAVRTLEKYGFRVDVVGNGVEVLEALRTLPYDLILMDCQMPEMDGYQATTAIRESASLPNPNIPIIAMTANAMRGDSEKCIASGMDDYVSKPVKPAALPRGHRAPTHRQKTRPLRIAGSLVVSRHQLKLSSSPPFARPPRLSSPGSGGCGKPRLYLRFQMNADPVGGMRIFYVEVDGFCSDDSGCRAFDDVFCNRRVRRSETRGLFADRRRERVAHGRNRIYSLGSEKPRHPTQIFGRSTKTRKSDQGDPRLHRPKSRSDHTRSRRRNGLGTSASRSESGAHSGDPRRSGHHDDDDTLYTTLIASDFVNEGRMAGDWLVKRLNGKGNIVELQGSAGAAPAIDRKKGFAEAIAKSPGLKITKSQTGEFTRTKGKEVMEAFLKSDAKNIQAVYAHNDDMALGAIQAIEAAGLKPGKDIVVVSVDGVKPAFEAMVAGKLNATVECNPLLGPAAFDAINDVLAQKTLAKKTVVKDQVYDQAAAASAIASRKY